MHQKGSHCANVIFVMLVSARQSKQALLGRCRIHITSRQMSYFVQVSDDKVLVVRVIADTGTTVSIKRLLNAKCHIQEAKDKSGVHAYMPVHVVTTCPCLRSVCEVAGRGRH